MRRAYPHIGRVDARNIARLVIDATESIPDPQREWVVDLAAAAMRVADAYGTEREVMALRNMIELIRGTEADDPTPHKWQLTNAQGLIVGSFEGTRREYERLQASLITQADKPAQNL